MHSDSEHSSKEVTVQQLQAELEQTRRKLERTIEELGSANEELRCSNEELLSMNEQLQVANEQLVASQGQLQMSSKVLARARSDMENLLRSTRIATVFLDEQLRIRGFTSAAKEIYRLRDSDIGRMLSDIQACSASTPPLPPAADVSEDRPSGPPFVGEDGRYWSRRILPYHTEDGVRDGIVVTFSDVTRLEQRDRQLRTITDAVPAKIAYVGGDLRYRFVNQAYAEHHHLSVDSILGCPLDEIMGATAYRVAEPYLNAVLEGQQQHFTLTLHPPHVPKVTVDDVSFTPEVGPSGGVSGFYISAIDVTDQMLDKQRLRESEERLSLALRASGMGVFEWDLRTGELQLTEQESELFGLQPGEPWHIDQFMEVLHPDDRLRLTTELRSAVEGKSEYDSQFRIIQADGEVRWIAGEAVVQRDQTGQAVRMIGTNWDVTDHMQRQIDLRLRDRAVNAIQSGIVILDATKPDYPIIYLNQGFEQMTGYTAEELIGKSWDSLQGPETGQATVQQIREALSEQRECIATLLHYRKDGSSFWSELRLSTVEDNLGCTTHFVGVQHDVTEQIQNERFLRRVLNSLFAFAGVCTPDGILVEANRTALDSAGLEAEEVLGKPFADTYWWSYDPDVQESLRAAIKRAAQGEQTRYDVNIRIAENQFLTIDFQIVPMRDDQGMITHLIPSAIDITQRLRDQERLTVLGTMAEQSNDFIGISDLSGQGIFLNAAGRRLIGFDPPLVLEEANVRDFFFPEDWPLAAQIVRQVIAEGQASREMRFRHFQTGAAIDVLWDVFRIDDPTSGAPFAIGTITQDIRQQKADQRRLIEAREKADSANRSKTEFLANMSHEIRTPMTAILGFADLLGEQLERDDDRQLIQTIQENGKHLLQIINDILDLSKIESGKLAIALRPCSPAALLQEIGLLMEVRAADKRLKLSTKVGPDVPTSIQSDPLRIKQILINLVGNAIKFTDHGKIELSVRYKRSTGELRFSVRDTGIGIDPESQRLLFEPFTQVDGSDTRSTGGTGLGLAISRRLAERLGGQLAVDSQLDVGSTFSLSLHVPQNGRGASPSDKVSAGEHDENAEPETSIQLDCRVLVVDDRAEIRFLADRILTAAGAEVTSAGSAQQALEIVDEREGTARSIDVVLTDIQMPQMDGYQLARRLRQRGFDRAIIALTAHALRTDLDRCLAAGCDAYASKPLDRQQLLRLIAKHTA